MELTMFQRMVLRCLIQILRTLSTISNRRNGRECRDTIDFVESAFPELKPDFDFFKEK